MIHLYGCRIVRMGRESVDLITLSGIVREFESRLGFRKGTLAGRARRHDLAHCRQALMAAMREYFDVSQDRIAASLGLADHTTILHGERAVHRRLDRGCRATVRYLSLAREVCEAA